MVNLWISFAAAASLGVSQPTPVRYIGGFSGKNVTVCLDGRQVKTTFAGKLAFQDATHRWTSVCADVRSPIAAGRSFWVRPMKSTTAPLPIRRAGNIVSRFFAAARTPEQCAGLQLAVWEAIEDGGERPDFANGRFRARADSVVFDWSFAYYEAMQEDGDATYLQTGGQGGGQGQLSS